MNQEPQNITGVKTIAERLKKAREEAGLSQPELARKAGVSPGTIGNIESEQRRNPRELLAIARAVNVNAEWLKTGRGRKNLDPQQGDGMEGWPLDPKLLAALQNADQKTRKRAEIAIMNALDWTLIPAAQETDDAA